MRRSGTIVAAILLLLPVAYVSMLLATTIHEVVGHGLLAKLCGGEWHGFRIQLDAMGSAWVHAPDHGILVVSGGLISTTLAGVLALLVAWRARRPLPGLVLGTFALVMFTELVYGFWDAIWMGRTGDVGQILRVVDSASLRWTLIFGQGVLYVAGVYLASLVPYKGRHPVP